MPASTDFAPTGPGTLAGRYMRRFWHPVYRSQDLPPGRAVPIRVMSEDFTLYRGEAERPHPTRLLRQAAPASPIAMGEGNRRAPSPAAAGEGGGEGGTPHLLAFRCAHRGTQLSTGWVEGDALRCFYHGWKYDPSGQCVEQPAEPEPFCQKIRIRSYPVQEYLGLIFAYFGETEPPPLPSYSEFEDGLREVHEQRLACNYFQRVENALDPVHTAFVHRYPHRSRYGMDGAPCVEAVETEWGITIHTSWPSGYQSAHHLVMPNALVIKARAGETGEGPFDLIGWRVPVDDESQISFTLDRLRESGEGAQRYLRGADRQALAGRASALGERVLAGELRIEDVEDRAALFELQDYVAQVGQGTIAARSNERLGRSDAGIVLLRQVWARELRALVDGRPLKRWAESIRTAED